MNPINRPLPPCDHDACSLLKCSYPELLPYQQGVVAEKQELDERITQLDQFISKELHQALPTVEQMPRLYYQLEVMRLYSRILGERIADFMPE